MAPAPVAVPDWWRVLVDLHCRCVVTRNRSRQQMAAKLRSTFCTDATALSRAVSQHMHALWLKLQRDRIRLGRRAAQSVSGGRRVHAQPVLNIRGTCAHNMTSDRPCMLQAEEDETHMQVCPEGRMQSHAMHNACPVACSCLSLHSCARLCTASIATAQGSHANMQGIVQEVSSAQSQQVPRLQAEGTLADVSACSCHTPRCDADHQCSCRDLVATTGSVGSDHVGCGRLQMLRAYVRL